MLPAGENLILGVIRSVSLGVGNNALYPRIHEKRKSLVQIFNWLQISAAAKLIHETTPISILARLSCSENLSK